MLKTCFKCARELPRTEFYKHPQMGDGLLGKCKECTRTDVKARYALTIVERQAYEAKRNATPERMARLRSAHLLHNKRNPEKARARNAVASHKDLYPNAHEMCVQDAIYNAKRTGEEVVIGRATYRVSPGGLVTELDTTLTDPSTTAFAQAMAKSEAEHNVTRAELAAARSLIARYESAMRSSAATVRAVYPNADPTLF